MTTLSHLDEKVMLDVLKERFTIDKIYTWTGRILLAVNPYKNIDIYGIKANINTPHIYSIAESAMQDLKSGQSKQISILISGESGAGKTENAKYIMRYLSYFGKSENSIETKVLASNPILEAFGNAKTTQNHNSSRFGKYIKIHFDSFQNILGAEIQTFLLEKVRVIVSGANERNFHIWYQIMAEYNITDKFNYLANSEILEDNFDETKKALKYFGINSDTVATLLLGILYLGNIEFDNQGIIIDNTPLVEVSKYWKLPVKKLQKLLTFRKIKAGREIIHAKMKQKECVQRRDTLAKSLYSCLFEWVVAKINTHLIPEKSSQASIGILDIFGFENFEKNAFEQLCINFTNEILQQVFQNFVFEQEQEEYAREEIEWKDISFPTNDEIISVIDQQIFVKLDEESNLTKPSHQKLIRNIEKIKHSNVSVSKIQKGKGVFQIDHYAGPVEYGKSLIDKNMDLMHPEQNAYSQNSDHEILSTFKFKTHRKVKTASVSKQFRKNIQELRKIIFGTKPYFVRCIKPNTKAVAELFDPQLISKQLRYCGILEATKISRAGFPARFEHVVFLQKYGNLFNGGNSNIRKGKTKYYLKYNAFLMLESALALRRKHSCNKIIKVFRKWDLNRKTTAVKKIMSFYRGIKILHNIRNIAKKAVAVKKINTAAKKINTEFNKYLIKRNFIKFKQQIENIKAEENKIVLILDQLIDASINKSVEKQKELQQKQLEQQLQQKQLEQKQLEQQLEQKQLEQQLQQKQLEQQLEQKQLEQKQLVKINKSVEPKKGELVLMQTQYQQLSCVQEEVEKLSTVKEKVDNIEKEVTTQMNSVKERINKELLEQVKDMQMIKDEVKKLQLVKNGLQEELGQLSSIRKELSSLKSFQEDVKKIKENAIETSKNLDDVGISAKLFKNSVSNILEQINQKSQMNELIEKKSKRSGHTSKNRTELSDNILTDIYNKNEKERKN